MPYISLQYHWQSRRQVLFFQWQGIGPARTWCSAATVSSALASAPLLSKTNVLRLSCSVVCLILSLAILTQYRRVQSDRQMDWTHDEGIYRVIIASTGKNSHDVRLSVRTYLSYIVRFFSNKVHLGRFH